MRSRLRFFIVCSILILTLSAKKSNTENQKKDLAVFKSVLIHKEGKLDLHVDEDSIYIYFNELENKFKTELTVLDQFKLYASTLRRIQCGHTQIHPNKAVLKEWFASKNALPIDYYLIGKKLVVNNLLPIDYPIINNGKSLYQQKKRIEANSQIISIDNKSVAELMAAIGNYLSSDENSIDFKYFQVSQMFEFFRHISSPFSTDSVQIEYIADGDTNKIYMQTGTLPINTMNNRLQMSAKKFRASESNIGEFSIAGKYGYFRFRSFKSSFGNKYEEFLKRSFHKMESKKIDKLIIDLRGNTGGAMQYSLMRYFVGEGVSLGKYIVEKPQKMADSRHLKKLNPNYFKHKRMSNIQAHLKRRGLFNNGEVKTKSVNEELIFNGKIVVITDEGTFSSASILACHLKTLKNAKIIGRRPGGSFYTGNAGSLTLQLPKSKLKVFINPNTFYSHLAPTATPLAIKKPDIELNPLILNERKRDQYYFKQAQKVFK
jgi:hypothetical protein